MTSGWDAGTYHRVSDVHTEWAEQVLGRLALEGDETVLDAGCGSGRVTAMLLERLRLPYVNAVADRLGDPLEIDYVRLNVSARRAV